MILQYKTLDSSLNIIDLSLWIVSVVITFFLSIYTIGKFISKKDEMEKYQKENIFTWIIFLVFLSAGNTCNILWRFVIPEKVIYELVDSISIILVSSGTLIKILNIERAMKRSQIFSGHYFSITMLISIIYVAIIYPFIREEVGIIQISYVILAAVGYIVFPGIFAYLALKSTGNARRKALIVVIGALIIGGGLLFQPQNVETFFSSDPNYDIIITEYTILCPIMITIGAFLIFISYRKSF
jgi:hypothetical protein